MKIGFLACPGTLTGSPVRRADAFEHDQQVAALRGAMEPAGMELVEMDWRRPVQDFAGMQLVLLGTVWDYQDSKDAFLGQLDRLEQAGIILCNSAGIVRWNIDKSYLRELADAGAPTIPTLWPDAPCSSDVEAAFAHFACDTVVVKRRVGAGAEGQFIFSRGDAALAGWTMDRPAMIQPFLPAITTEGEYSFIVIDGELSHCVLKTAAAGDYRIQSVYGGREEVFCPDAADRAAASAIIAALPFPTPLYARVDMVRGANGALALMEAEMIEPYLYPLQGPHMGEQVVKAITRQLGSMAPEDRPLKPAPGSQPLKPDDVEHI